MGDTTTVVFAIMSVSSIFIIGLSCLIYKCRSDAKQYDPESYGVSDVDNTNYRDDTLSEEDQLMIPLDREDTIDSLRQQLSQINVANVRYIQVAAVDKAFKIKDGMEPREYIEGDIITFRDIAIGFVEKIPDSKVDPDDNLSKRETVIYSFCEQQLKCESIEELAQIHAVIVYLCKIVIRVKYNKKKSDQNVSMREENSDDFKADLLPIVEWIWTEKMKDTKMNTEKFAQNMCSWIEEIESS